MKCKYISDSTTFFRYNRNHFSSCSARTFCRGSYRGLTNVIQGILTNPRDIPFALVNIAIGIIVGMIAKKTKFDIKTAVITGLILSIVAPLIGTPIAVFMYGGLTGGGTDILFAWLLATGQKIFTAAFIPRVAGNLVDKIGSCILVSSMLRYIPKEYINKKAA